jgi:hypothetical protein
MPFVSFGGAEQAHAVFEEDHDAHEQRNENERLDPRSLDDTRADLA